jgi:hypothetical protein
MATVQQHESSPQQMLRILRQLNPYDSLWALLNWIYGPPFDTIVLSLVIRLQKVDDIEAEFILKNISSHVRSTKIETKELEQILGKARVSPQNHINYR